MISEVGLSEKNKENALLPLPKILGHVEILLYPCLQYYKGGNCSSQALLIRAVAIVLATESEIYR